MARAKCGKGRGGGEMHGSAVTGNRMRCGGRAAARAAGAPAASEAVVVSLLSIDDLPTDGKPISATRASPAAWSSPTPRKRRQHRV